MSEVIRLQGPQDALLFMDPLPELQGPELEPPRSPSPVESPSHQPPPWRHDVKALKAQLKILHYLLMSSFSSNADLTVLMELMEFIKEIMTSIDIFRPLQLDCLQLWERVASGVKTLQHREIEKKLASMPIDPPQEPPKKVTPPKHFVDARENAHDVFLRLVKASLDSRVDPEEQQRVHSVIEGILGPYKRLTHHLVAHPEGTVEHDVTKLLLTSHPSDYHIVRNRWSVRTLAQICKDLGTRNASKSQVGRFYKKIHWYRRIKEELRSPDPQFGAKMKAIGIALATLKEEDVLLYGDEFKFTSKKVAQYLHQSHAPEGLHYQLKERLGK